MRTILDNDGNRSAFDVCAVRNRKRSAKLACSFSVYDYGTNGAPSYGPAFYVGRTESHLPKPNEKRARLRIRVYPKVRLP